LLLDRFIEALDLLVEEVQVRKDRTDDEGVVRLKSALERLLEGRIFARRRPLARSASTSGSVVPAASALSIALPDLPRMSDATQSSLMRR
jgi:hypothetical protein